MTPHDVIQRIGQSTAAAGMQPTTTAIYGNQVLVAQTSKFKLQWFATKLYTFLIACEFPAGTADPASLDRFLTGAAEFAKANKQGLPLGLQTGIAALVVAVTEHADPAAHQWASAVHGRQFAVIPFPVLVDAATRQVTRPQRMVLGGVYSKYLKRLVDQHVAGAVNAAP